MGRKLDWTSGFGKVWGHLWRVERFSMRSAADRTEALSYQGLVGPPGTKQMWGGAQVRQVLWVKPKGRRLS